MSSSQLTNSYFSEGWVQTTNQPPSSSMDLGEVEKWRSGESSLIYVDFGCPVRGSEKNSHGKYGPFIDDFHIKASIYKEFSMASLKSQMVEFGVQKRLKL